MDYNNFLYYKNSVVRMFLPRALYRNTPRNILRSIAWNTQHVMGPKRQYVKCKIKRTLSEKEEKAGMKARKPRDPESPKGFPGGLTRRP